MSKITITPIIGLEVHLELKTKTKMFCACPSWHFHVKPNSHTCPVCLGLPGALPVPNKTALDWCVKIGLSLNCSVNKHSFFERKNYFYPDLPKGYQISQYQQPLTISGFIHISNQRIRINRAHMEEDTAKSIHSRQNGQKLTLIDFNRSGVPLVEIVTEPDITSSQMAKDYLLKLQQLMRYLDVSDADIEKGSMRCEPTVNIKIKTSTGEIYTPIVEIKNVASLTGVQNAIEFELNRQLNDWQQAGIVKNSSNKTTRGWDAVKGVTFLQREKEGSSDYRYFPEPDIPPIEYSDDQINHIKSTIPELPDQKMNRYLKDYDLSEYDASLLASDINFARSYEKALGDSRDTQYAKFIANLFTGPLKNYINQKQEDIDIKKINPTNFLILFENVRSNQISLTVARQIIIDSYLTGQNPLAIATKMGLIQLSDVTEIEEIVRQVFAANPKAVADYQKNPNSIGFLIGQVMKLSGGKANPQVARQIIEKTIPRP